MSDSRRRQSSMKGSPITASARRESGIPTPSRIPRGGDMSPRSPRDHQPLSPRNSPHLPPTRIPQPKNSPRALNNASMLPSIASDSDSPVRVSPASQPQARGTSRPVTLRENDPSRGKTKGTPPRGPSSSTTTASPSRAVSGTRASNTSNSPARSQGTSAQGAERSGAARSSPSTRASPSSRTQTTSSTPRNTGTGSDSTTTRNRRTSTGHQRTPVSQGKRGTPGQAGTSGSTPRTSRRAPSRAESVEGDGTSQGVVPGVVYVLSRVPRLMDSLQRHNPGVTFAELNVLGGDDDDDDGQGIVSQIEFLIADPGLLTKKHLLAFRALKWLQSTWAGVDHLLSMLSDIANEADAHLAQMQAGHRVKVRSLENEIADLQSELDQHLADAAPQVELAKESVKGVKREWLGDLKSLNKPPNGVRICLQAVAVLLHDASGEALEWKQVRKMTANTDFITSIINVDPADILEGVCKRIETEYIANPDFNYDKVMRASKACGPLYKWVVAMIAYARAVRDFKPLTQNLKARKEELRRLTETHSEMERRATEARSPSYLLSRLGGCFGQAMAEYVVSHIISYERGYPYIRDAQVDGADDKWGRGKKLGALYRTFPQLVVGVLGYGDIGRHVGQLCLAMGAKRVLALTSRQRQNTGDNDRLVYVSTLEEVLSECDYVINILPSTPATQGLLAASTFQYAKDGMVFINIGRGDIVEDDVILDALDCNQIRGCILDVFNEEPLPDDHPFYERPDIVVTPHVAAVSQPGDVARLWKSNKGLYDAGQPLKYAVDFDKGY